MNSTAFQKDRPSLQLLGKEFVIAVVVIFSALSFTLGYFVGKNGMDKKSENLSQATEITPIPQKQEPTPLPQPIDKPSDPIAEAKQIESAKSLQPVKEKPQERSLSLQIPTANNQEPAEEDSLAGQGSRKSDERLYTVQIAAFKSSAEAEAFAKKHANNGLKTYITTFANKKKEKIYKVKTGEFKDRKKAEILSLKLNKTEKLKTFVTLKS